MNECLLCAAEMTTQLSWKSLFGLERQTKICDNCSKSFERADIIEENELLERMTSLYTYNDMMRDYLHQYKFLQDVALADVFKDDLHAALKTTATIVPIPMHREKKIDRTFAHVEQLLLSAGVPYVDVLEKIGTEAMGEKSKEQRLAMPTQFKLKENVNVDFTTVVLVDDIVTTGTTLHHAATVLKQAGATRIEAVTLIRA